MNSHYQIIFLWAIIAVAMCEMSTPWPGPYADHVIGKVVEETPEVAEARNQHAKIYADVLAVLPELPEEERFPGVDNEQAPIPAVPASPSLPSVNYQSPIAVVPVSPIGEPLEVVQARQAHLKAVEQAWASLPKKEKKVEPVRITPSQQMSWLPVDTPEVAAAKLEHARAIAAVLGRV